jgi:hypothetical protein
MDQDDPEQHIAELERKHAEPVGQPRHDPAASPNRASSAKARRRQLLFVRLFCLLVLIGLPLFPFAVGGYDVYAYHVGAPTTATNVHCHNGGRTRYCTGTWSLGGQSYTGTVEGASHGNGASMDVRVYGDTAYTAQAGRKAFMWGLFVVIIFCVGIMIRLARARTQTSR